MASGNTSFYLHPDPVGNTLLLTDGAGAVIERYDYDDFGLPSFLTSDGVATGESSTGVGNPFLSRGMQWDAETGFYHGSGGGSFDPRTAKSINGSMPNRISMNVTVPKQTQGATFGEKVNAGLQSCAGQNPWTGDAPSAMKKGMVKFFNETKGFGMVTGGGGANGQALGVPGVGMVSVF